MRDHQLHFGVVKLVEWEKGRYRLRKCYAQKHIIVDFALIFNSFNVWISSKKYLYASDWVVNSRNNIWNTKELNAEILLHCNHESSDTLYNDLQNTQYNKCTWQLIEWISTVSTLLINRQPCAGRKIFWWGHLNISWW